MGHADTATADQSGRFHPNPSSAAFAAEPLRNLDHAGAVSWGAVIAGAAAAAALSLILLMLGVGLGLSSVSPWGSEGMSATSFGVSTICWLTFTQLVASATGGYMAGRLRTRWLSVHGDEVHFRDTAHGFLAWAVASLATAALLTSVIGSIVSGGAQAGTSLAGAASSTAAVGASGGAVAAVTGSAMGSRTDSDAAPVGMGYFVDSLFRKSNVSGAAGTSTAVTTGTSAGAGTAAGADTSSAVQPATTISSSGASSVASNTASSSNSNSAGATEVGRIFAINMQSATLPADDVRYVGQLVSQRTGLSQADAEKRVNDTYARMQASMQQAKTSAMEAADKARKAAAGASLWIFISLLIGAFVASLSATYGGRRRDL